MLPPSAGQKWFVFMEHDTLYIHNNWSGHTICQLTFTEVQSRDGTYVIESALVTDDIPCIAARGSDVEEQRAVEDIIITAFDL